MTKLTTLVATLLAALLVTGCSPDPQVEVDRNSTAPTTPAPTSSHSAPEADSFPEDTSQPSNDEDLPWKHSSGVVFPAGSQELEAVLPLSTAQEVLGETDPTDIDINFESRSGLEMMEMLEYNGTASTGSHGNLSVTVSWVALDIDEYRQFAEGNLGEAFYIDGFPEGAIGWKTPLIKTTGVTWIADQVVFTLSATTTEDAIETTYDVLLQAARDQRAS